MGDSQRVVRILGAGLAGSEAALQLADRGIRVELVEMRPEVGTAVHKTGNAAELVCSNSLRGDGLHNARTLAGDLAIEVAGSTVWMEMGQAKVLRQLTEAECPALYEAYGLTPEVLCDKIREALAKKH